jgi:hypothetical protein
MDVFPLMQPQDLVTDALYGMILFYTYRGGSSWAYSGEAQAQAEANALKNPYTNSKPKPDFGATSLKKLRQFQDRGWTHRRVMDAFYKGSREPTTNLANGNPATRYYNPKTGQFVVIDDITGEIIQFGGPGFIP